MPLTDDERDRAQQALDATRQAHSALERLSEAQLDTEHKRSLLARSAVTIDQLERLVTLAQMDQPQAVQNHE